MQVRKKQFCQLGLLLREITGDVDGALIDFPVDDHDAKVANGEGVQQMDIE
jgi:hypothetical protein